jgi:hypothetical protein
MHHCTPTVAPTPAPAQPPLRFPHFERQLLQEGYRRGVPHGLSTHTIILDETLCQRMTCGSCRHPGLEYHPFHQGRSYRVLARCPRCRHAEEF